MSDVISHIIQVLKHPILQRLLAAAYTQILLNHIFPYPHFTMELTPSNWTGSVIEYFSLTPSSLFASSFLSTSYFISSLNASLPLSLSPPLYLPFLLSLFLYSISLLIFLSLFFVSFSLSLLSHRSSEVIF